MDKPNRQKDLKEPISRLTKADVSPRLPANEPQTGALNVRKLEQAVNPPVIRRGQTENSEITLQPLGWQIPESR